jgi:hypothetical protein
MSRNFLLIIAASTMMAGCSSVASFDLPNGYRGVTAAKVVDKIDCEILASFSELDPDTNPQFRALRVRPGQTTPKWVGYPNLNNGPHYYAEPTKDLNNWAVNVVLNLEVDDGAGLTPTLSYTTPYSLAGNTIGISGSAS